MTTKTHPASRQFGPLRRRNPRWNPPGIDGLVAWYNADGITGVLDGGTVSTWRDISTSSYDMTQATANLRPTLVRRATEQGRSVVRFADDANDDNLTSTMDLDQPFTILAAGKPGSSAEYRALWEDGEALCNGFLEEGTGKIGMYAGELLVGTNNVAGDWHVFTFLANGASSKMFVDGVLEASGNAGTNSIVGDGGQGNLQYGADHFEFSPWDGDMGEILVYDSALDASELALATGWLTGRWL